VITLPTFPAKWLALWALASQLAVLAQSQIQIQRVTTVATTASRITLARGSAFEVTGASLGPDEPVTAEVPLPEELDGVSIILTAADGSAASRTPMISVSAGRLVAIVPSPLQPGEYKLNVVRGADRSATFTVTVAGSNFGPITNANVPGGLVLGRLLTPDSPAEPITYIRPAFPGARLELDAAGLGPIDGPDSEFPPAVNRAEEAVLVMGELQIPVEYLGRNPERPGFDKVVVVLPAEGLPAANCSVSFRIVAGGFSTSSVALPLAAEPGVICPNSIGLTEEGLKTLSEGGSIIKAGFDVANGSVASVLPGATYESLGDGFSGGFVSYTPAAMAVLMADAQVLKPYFDGGGCFVHDALQGAAGTYVDAGDLVTLTGPAWTLPVPRTGAPSPYAFAATLTSTIVGFPVSLPSLGLPLTPGKYVVQGTGGSVVGPFQAEVEMSPGFKWTNASVVTDTVDRNSDLVFKWSGGGPNDVMQALGVVTGPAPEDKTRIVTRLFMCYGRAPDGQIVVPSSVLKQMPVVPRVQAGGPGPALMGTISLTQTSAPDKGIFTAPLVGGGTTQGAAFTFGYSYTKSPLAFP
jgi:uncharacterized protein (TIGR03437 family)